MSVEFFVVAWVAIAIGIVAPLAAAVVLVGAWLWQMRWWTNATIRRVPQDGDDGIDGDDDEYDGDGFYYGGEDVPHGGC